MSHIAQNKGMSRRFSSYYYFYFSYVCPWARVG